MRLRFGTAQTASHSSKGIVLPKAEQTAKQSERLEQPKVAQSASQCKTFKGREPCETFTHEGMYPCYWRLPNAKDCRPRQDAQKPYNHRYRNAKYPYLSEETPRKSVMDDVDDFEPSRKSVMDDVDEEPELNRMIYTCTNRDEKACGSNPNCFWKPNQMKCVRKVGHNESKKVQYQGPIGEQGFGKKQKKVVRKVKKASKKPSKRILTLAKKLRIKVTIKRGNKRVYKTTKVLTKQIKAKLKKLKKNK